MKEAVVSAKLQDLCSNETERMAWRGINQGNKTKAKDAMFAYAVASAFGMLSVKNHFPNLTFNDNIKVKGSPMQEQYRWLLKAAQVLEEHPELDKILMEENWGDIVCAPTFVTEPRFNKMGLKKLTELLACGGDRLKSSTRGSYRQLKSQTLALQVSLIDEKCELNSQPLNHTMIILIFSTTSSLSVLYRTEYC